MVRPGDRRPYDTSPAEAHFGARSVHVAARDAPAAPLARGKHGPRTRPPVRDRRAALFELRRRDERADDARRRVAGAVRDTMLRGRRVHDDPVVLAGDEGSARRDDDPAHITGRAPDVGSDARETGEPDARLPDEPARPPLHVPRRYAPHGLVGPDDNPA